MSAWTPVNSGLIYSIIDVLLGGRRGQTAVRVEGRPYTTIESNLVTPAILGARFTMNPVLILLALSYFSWIWGFTGALLSVPILLTITALVDHLGKPNLIGFVFGEPLFHANVLDLSDED